MSASARHFIRHYVEMVIAMFVGMAALALPADAALLALGTSSGAVWDDAPALMLGWMAFSMTAPMVAWMRYRGHAWRPCWEMAASMIIPTIGVAVLLRTGLVTDTATLLGIQHAVMFPSMLVAMLLRPEEYTGGHGHHSASQEVTA